MSNLPRLENDINVITISNPRKFSVGRALSCDYIIKSRNVSRVHCIFSKTDGVWRLQDTSTNGTFVNGKKYRQALSDPLNNGDCIGLGGTDLQYKFINPSASPSSSVIDISDEQLLAITDSLEARIRHDHDMAMAPSTSIQMARPPVNHNDDNVEIQNASPVFSRAPAPSTSTQIPRSQHFTVSQTDNIGSEVVIDSSGSDESEVNLYDCENARKIPRLDEEAIDSATKASESGQSQSKSKSEQPLLPREPQQQQPEQPQPGVDFVNAENEFQCSICSELFVKAVTLNCSHSFCKLCINEWRKNKSVCPICRAQIISVAPTIVLDNFINKMMESASEEMKQDRDKLLAERKTLEEEAQSKRTHRVASFGGATAAPTSAGPSNATRLNRLARLLDEAEGSSESEHNDSFDYMDPDHFIDLVEEEEEEDDDLDYDYNGAPGVYYGGYGRCYSCGERGHWANGCPNMRQDSRRRRN